MRNRLRFFLLPPPFPVFRLSKSSVLLRPFSSPGLSPFAPPAPPVPPPSPSTAHPPGLRSTSSPRHPSSQIPALRARPLLPAANGSAAPPRPSHRVQGRRWGLGLGCGTPSPWLLRGASAGAGPGDSRPLRRRAMDSHGLKVSGRGLDACCLRGRRGAGGAGGSVGRSGFSRGVLLLCLCCPGPAGAPARQRWPVAVSPGPPPWALLWNLEVRGSQAANELPLVCLSHPVWGVYFYFVSHLFGKLGHRITPTAPPSAIF